MNFNKIEITMEERKALKHAEFFNENGVYAFLFLSPHSKWHVEEVYFVSGTNGDEFGQFPTLTEALSKAIQMAKLSEIERKKFDQ